MKATKHGRPGAFARLMGFDKRAADEDREDKKDKDADEDGEEEEAEEDDKEGKAEDDNDDDDEKVDDDEEDDEAKKATVAERRRCSLIIAHGIKIGSVEQAGVLAFDTDLQAKAAISTLDAVGAAGSGTKGQGNLSRRMSGVREPTVGTGGSQSPGADSAQGLAGRMLGAYDKALGKSR